MKKVLTIILTLVSLSSSALLFANAQKYEVEILDNGVSPTCLNAITKCMNGLIYNDYISNLLNDKPLNMCLINQYAKDYTSCLQSNCSKADLQNEKIINLIKQESMIDFLVDMAKEFNKQIID